MWNLIVKDLRRRWRNPVATAAMIIFPIFMASAIGTIASGGSSGFPIIDVLIQNDDEDGVLSTAIIGALGQGQGQEYLNVMVVEEGAREMMENGEASALIVLPANFTSDVLTRTPATIEVVRNPAEGIKPEIIVQGAETASVYLDQGGRLLGDELGTLNDMFQADQMPNSMQVGLVAGSMMTKITGAERYLFPPLVSISHVKEVDEEGGPDFNIMGYLLIMTTVMALLFIAARSVYDLFEEAKSGMLRRQLASPVSIATIVGSKMIFGVVLGLIVLSILAVFGLVMGWVSPPVNIPAVVLLSIAFTFAACGILGMLFGMVNNEKQAGIAAWLVIMGMSAVGGSMVPIEQMPAAMAAASKFTLNYWVVDAYKEVLFWKGGVLDIASQLLLIAGVGVGTSLIAQVLLARRLGEMNL